MPNNNIDLNSLGYENLLQKDGKYTAKKFKEKRYELYKKLRKDNVDLGSVFLAQPEDRPSTQNNPAKEARPQTVANILETKRAHKSFDKIAKQEDNLKDEYYQDLMDSLNFYLVTCNPTEKNNIHSGLFNIGNALRSIKDAKPADVLEVRNNLNQLVDNFLNDLAEFAIEDARKPELKKEKLDALENVRNNLQIYLEEYKLASDYNQLKNYRKFEEAINSYRDYDSEVGRVTAAFNAINNKPLTTWALNKLKNLGLPVWNNNLNRNVFLIIESLDNLGFYKESYGIREFFRNYEENNKDADNKDLAKQKMQGLLNTFYATFMVVSEKINVDAKELKKLKKAIHAFAEENGFEKKIFNIQRTFKKGLHDQETLGALQEANAVKLAYVESEVARKKQKKNLNDAEVDQLRQKLLQQNGDVKYAYISSLTNHTTAKKRNNRAKKSAYDNAAFWISLIVAIGEGLVAAVFFGWLLIPSLLIFGLAGFAVNYYLFRSDSFDTLKQVFLGRLYKDENGYDISAGKKIAIKATLISSVLAGTIFGSFAFYSALIAFIGLGLVALFPPLGIGLAVGIGIVSAIANATMLYCVIADFIKNERWVQIKNYFVNTYTFAHNDPRWAESSTLGKIKMLAKYAGKWAFNGFFLVTGVAASVTMMILLVGLAQTKAIAVLRVIVSDIPIHTAKLISRVLVAVAIAVNSFLYVRGINRAFDAIKDKFAAGAMAVVKVITWPFTKTKEKISEWYKTFSENKLRRYNTVANTTINVVLTGATIPNALGQAGGPYHDPLAKLYVSTAMQVPEQVAGRIGQVVAATGSQTVNQLAIDNETKMPAVVKTPEASKKSNGSLLEGAEQEPAAPKRQQQGLEFLACLRGAYDNKDKERSSNSKHVLLASDDESSVKDHHSDAEKVMNHVSALVA